MVHHHRAVIRGGARDGEGEAGVVGLGVVAFLRFATRAVEGRIRATASSMVMRWWRFRYAIHR
jgi:hypothetical protein